VILTALSLAIAACPEQGRRVTCVVDGDTIWHEGTKLRIRNIDTPEIDQAKCPLERQLGERAKARLIVLLSGGYAVHYSGKLDGYKRPLVTITVNGRDVGSQLVSEGFARPYGNGRRPWCPIPS
jgi:micrococcal nuclease